MSKSDHLWLKLLTRRRPIALLNLTKDIPQLVVAGHGAIDDPDATSIYDITLDMLETKYSDIQFDVVIVRVGQILNALMSNAKVALQLSTREGL
ncbi:glycosyltransferase family 4 protein [Periconia macrospinosa]|uniref:Glycosyltransferase family 4 protein n=1 Tax=Periconia macrospinosa TaxID=97972 RepID=A0A2V1D3L7_9PLEO|nr:glycosyltransferase family 4 protein [Periconia macrospinosa]